MQGKVLRLKQQYFFVSCSIQDIIRRYLVKHDRTFSNFADKVAIQMNDTHPSLAVTELMRIFLDEYGLNWDKAWDITTHTCAYTNHTLLSEALEKWPVPLFGKLLPRHLQIIYEINRRFLRDVSVMYVGDEDREKRMSLIEEGDVKRVRMAHLAIVGSYSVNGVAALHTELLKKNALKDFNEMFPEKFNNKTNGVTPRRWLLASNPALAELISENIGTEWIKDLDQLRKLEPLAEDPDFQKQFSNIKYKNKETLAKVTKDLTGFSIHADSMFDVQVKRIHEYKRQTLNILHAIYCWLRIKNDKNCKMKPKTYIFGGKAAPSYTMAKLTIKLICHAAEMINKDPSTNNRIKVVFLPNYRVSLAEKIFPASDLSEQISTAGFEASGTGNMKFALNGALTIGTLDGANIEIMEEVGDENIFIFGLTADEVKQLKPNYNPRSYYERDPLLKQVIDLIYDGFFSPEERKLFHPLINNLLEHDPFLVLADFDSYRQSQEKVCKTYLDQKLWTKMAILNVARMGKFSSDRTIKEYNRDIWKAEPLQIVKD
jgi:glycogen phosphorylase